MHDKTILERAVRKAKQNGFDFKNGGICWLLEQESIIEGWEYLKHKRLVMVGVDSTTQTYMGLNDIIFSHEFAKAFWGEKLCEFQGSHKTIGHGIEYLVNGAERISDIASFKLTLELPCWEWYLQQMVLEKEPLKYLERFL